MRWSSAGGAYICMAAEYTLRGGMTRSRRRTPARRPACGRVVGAPGRDRRARRGGAGGGGAAAGGSGRPAASPAVAAKAYVVMDQQTGVVLAE